MVKGLFFCMMAVSVGIGLLIYQNSVPSHGSIERPSSEVQSPGVATGPDTLPIPAATFTVPTTKDLGKRFDEPLNLDETRALQDAKIALQPVISSQSDIGPPLSVEDASMSLQMSSRIDIGETLDPTRDFDSALSNDRPTVDIGLPMDP